MLIIDGDTEVEEPCIFQRGVYLPVFYCSCYVMDISTDMLEEQVSEERDPDLIEEEYIRMEYSREDHWRDVADDGYDKKKIHVPRWEVHTKTEVGVDKERVFGVRYASKTVGVCLDLCEG